jgi:integrase/recombinase XerD
MPYQFKREPLLPEEATRLAQACQTVREKLVIWTLLHTGLRVSELANLTPTQIDWQGHRLTIYGKGGPYGSRSKRRIIPLSARLQPLIAIYEAIGELISITYTGLP